MWPIGGHGRKEPSLRGGCACGLARLLDGSKTDRQKLPQACEFIVVFEVNRNAAAALRSLAEIDFCAEGRAKLLFE